MVNNLQGKALSLRHISWHCIRDEIPFSILSSYPDNSKPGTRSNIQALPHAWTKNECKMMIRKVHSIMKFYFCDSFHPFYLSSQYFYFYAFFCFLSFFLSFFLTCQTNFLEEIYSSIWGDEVSSVVVGVEVQLEAALVLVVHQEAGTIGGSSTSKK